MASLLTMMWARNALRGGAVLGLALICSASATAGVPTTGLEAAGALPSPPVGAPAQPSSPQASPSGTSPGATAQATPPGASAGAGASAPAVTASPGPAPSSGPVPAGPVGALPQPGEVGRIRGRAGLPPVI